MKFVLLLLFPFIGFAQKTLVENGKLNGILPVDDAGNVSYVVIKQADGVGKDELYRRARSWFTAHYSDEKNTTQVSELSTGELLGRGEFNVKARVGINNAKFAVYHTLKVDVKENKYRIVINDFTIDNQTDIYGKTKLDKVMMASKKTYETLYPEIDSQITALIGSLEKALATTNDF